MKYCCKCGNGIPKDLQFCNKCGFDFDSLEASKQTVNVEETDNTIKNSNSETIVEESKKNIYIFGFLQIFLGVFGIGRFYLGHYLKGTIHLCITLLMVYLVMQYFNCDFYSASYSEQISSNGYALRTISASTGDGLGFLATMCLLFNVAWCFCSGALSMGVEKLPKKMSAWFFILPVSLFLMIIPANIKTQEGLLKIDTPIVTYRDLYSSDITINYTVYTSYVKVELIPKYDIEEGTITIKFTTSSSYNLLTKTETLVKLTANQTYTYSYSTTSSITSSIEKCTYSVQGTKYTSTYLTLKSKN